MSIKAPSHYEPLTGEEMTYDGGKMSTDNIIGCCILGAMFIGGCVWLYKSARPTGGVPAETATVARPKNKLVEVNHFETIGEAKACISDIVKNNGGRQCCFIKMYTDEKIPYHVMMYTDA